MPRETWTVRLDVCTTAEGVFANAVLVDGPALVTGHGCAVREDADPACRGRALAARGALIELTQAMRAELEQGGPRHAARV